MSTSNPKRNVISMAMLRAQTIARLPKGVSSATSEPDSVVVCPAPSVAVSEHVARAPTSKVGKSEVGASSPPKAGAQRPFNREIRRRLGIDLSQPGLLRLEDVLRLYRVSRSTWYAGIKNGMYEPGIPIGPRCVAWRSEYIRALIANPPAFVRS